MISNEKFSPTMRVFYESVKSSIEQTANYAGFFESLKYSMFFTAYEMADNAELQTLSHEEVQFVLNVIAQELVVLMAEGLSYHFPLEKLIRDLKKHAVEDSFKNYSESERIEKIVSEIEVVIKKLVLEDEVPMSLAELKNFLSSAIERFRDFVYTNEDKILESKEYRELMTDSYQLTLLEKWSLAGVVQKKKDD
jgi:hypothetical protein